MDFSKHKNLIEGLGRPDLNHYFHLKVKDKSLEVREMEKEYTTRILMYEKSTYGNRL